MGSFMILPIIFIIVFAIMFTFVSIVIFSPKARAKWMGKQVKAMQYMVDENKEALEDLGTTTGNIEVNVKKNIIDQNEEILKETATKEANISKDAIEIKAKAIKDGFTKDTIYCKHCGAVIDRDSKFCKECGKEQ